jgi:hypothetical protein
LGPGQDCFSAKALQGAQALAREFVRERAYAVGRARGAIAMLIPATRVRRESLVLSHMLHRPRRNNGEAVATLARQRLAATKRGLGRLARVLGPPQPPRPGAMLTSPQQPAQPALEPLSCAEPSIFSSQTSRQYGKMAREQKRW